MTTNYVLNIGDSIDLPGTGYYPLLANDFPVTDGLVGLFLFGEGAANVARNYAPGQPDATPVVASGFSPVGGTGYVEFSGNHYLQTQIDETATMTLVAVARRPVVGGSAIIGNYVSPANAGVAMYGTDSDALLRGNTGRVSGAGAASVTSNLANWLAASFVVPATGAASLYNMTTGASGQTTATADRVISGGGKLRIGRFYDTGFTHANHINSAAIFSRAISAPERAAVKEWCTAYAAGFGIAV